MQEHSTSGYLFTSNNSLQKEKDIHLEYQELVKNAPIGIFISTPEGLFYSANPAMALMLGYDTPEELLNSITDIAFQIYAEPSDREKLQDLLKVHGQVFNHECRWLRRDGTQIWVSNNAYAVQDKKGKISHYQAFVVDITRQKKAEEKLLEQKSLAELARKQWQRTFDTIPDPIALIDTEHRIIRSNKAMALRLECAPGEIEGRFCYEVVHGLSEPPDFCPHSKMLFKGSFQKAEISDERLGGIFEVTATPMFDAGGQLTGSVHVARDITERNLAESRILIQKSHFQSIFENTKDAMAFFDTEERVFNINSQFTSMFGFELSEVRGLNINLAVDPEKKDPEHGYRRILRGENMEMEAVCRTKQARPIHVLLKGGPVQVDGQIVGGYAIYSDISDRKHVEERLKYLSLHDQLTGIYNRAYFENELLRLAKSREHPITIICFDVDGLKMVNDTLGHEHGDRLLKLSAKLLQDSLRESDVLARTGGDEFVALLRRTSRQDGLKIVERIRARIKAYNQKGKPDQIPLSISVGFACGEDEADDLAEVFREADDLMYRDKLSKDVTVRALIMRALISSMEERDFISRGHAHTVEDLCRRLGKKVQLSEKQISNLALLAQVHDLGNVGIPDHILFKPGPLTDEEWEVMRTHPEKGYRIASSNPVLAEIAGLILRHHERWDSSGYPLGLKKKEIPIECRILAIVDAFDAMTSDRPYRKALSVSEAGRELRKAAGIQFDPDLVEVFLEIVGSD